MCSFLIEYSDISYLSIECLLSVRCILGTSDGSMNAINKKPCSWRTSILVIFHSKSFLLNVVHPPDYSSESLPTDAIRSLYYMSYLEDLLSFPLTFIWWAWTCLPLRKDGGDLLALPPPSPGIVTGTESVTLNNYWSNKWMPQRHYKLISKRAFSWKVYVNHILSLRNNASIKTYCWQLYSL